jgi:hypothetical protein
MGNANPFLFEAGHSVAMKSPAQMYFLGTQAGIFCARHVVNVHESFGYMRPRSRHASCSLRATEVSMKVVRTFVAVAIAGLISIGSVAAQQSAPPPSDQERAKTPEPVVGELVSVAADTKTLVVKTSGDKEMTFTYSDQTEIVGADTGAAGLATATGSMVTVHYTMRGTTNVAVKIEVKPKM